MTEREYAENRAFYAKNLCEYARAVRDDIEAIIVNLDSGQEMPANKVRRFRESLEVLDRALGIYLEAQNLGRQGKPHTDKTVQEA